MIISFRAIKVVHVLISVGSPIFKYDHIETIFEGFLEQYDEMITLISPLD